MREEATTHGFLAYRYKTIVEGLARGRKTSSLRLRARQSQMTETEGGAETCTCGTFSQG